MVCLGNMCVDTLYKGDDDDDNNNNNNNIETPQTTKQNSCNNIFPRDMVCLGNMCVDTLHKGDNDDDDDTNNNVLFYCCEELKVAILYALNLSDLVSTFGIVATFAIFDIQRKLSRTYLLP